MKIVDRLTFLAMPAGTVYAKYVPSIFEALSVKGDTIYSEERPIDWFYSGLGADSIEAYDSGEWGQLLDASQETGADVPMDFNIQSRDGCFDDDQLFAVFMPADVEALIARLVATQRGTSA